jgi:hypothetical protein
MIKFNTTDLFNKTSLRNEQTAALSQTDLDGVVGGGGGGMINPQPLPPCRHGGSTDPRTWN